MSLSPKTIIRMAKRYTGESDSEKGLTVAELGDRLKGWFCLTYNTTLNDDRLLKMTLEDLLLHYYMNKIDKNPEEVDTELDDQSEEESKFEAWLKKEMSGEYITNEEMVEGQTAEEERYQKKIKERFPNKVTTDFSQFNKD